MTSVEFPTLKNDLLLRAARKEAVPRVPVWVMRQAGRYLPEYLEFNKDKDFFLTCRTPEFACEVTMQPIRRFDLDAAIIFSDILVIPQALGMEVVMTKGVGPQFPKPLDSPAELDQLLATLATKLGVDVTTLRTPGPDRGHIIVKDTLQYVYDAITLTRKTLDGKVPLLGFAGAPWTLLSYMIEGGGSRLYAKSKRWLHADSAGTHLWMALLADCIAAYLVRQIDAGAQGVQVFESHGGELSHPNLVAYSKTYIDQIAAYVKAQRPDIPRFMFARNVQNSVTVYGASFDVVSVDFPQDLVAAKRAAEGMGIAVQGNLDPAALTASKEAVFQMAADMVKSVRSSGAQEGVPVGYIANLGHGITPDINPDHLGAFIDGVHSIVA